MLNFKIDPEIQSLLPPLSEDELRLLEAKILADGPRDPVVVWEGEDGENILLDGHNRVGICNKHGLKFAVEHLKFPSRDAAMEWVVDNQLGRRNLTDEQRAYFIGKKYLTAKKTHGDFSRILPSGHFDHLGETQGKPEKTAQTVAEENGVTERTVRRNAAFAEAVDTIAKEQGEEAKQEILSGTSGKSKAEVVSQAHRLARAAVGLPEDGFKTPPAKDRKGAKDPAAYSKDIHAAIGKVVRYADRLADGRVKFSTMRDDVHKHLQAATNALVALEKATAS